MLVWEKFFSPLKLLFKNFFDDEKNEEPKFITFRKI
jgi:hypothetical protein